MQDISIAQHNAAITVIILILLIVLVCQVSCYLLWTSAIEAPANYISQLRLSKEQRAFLNSLIKEKLGKNDKTDTKTDAKVGAVIGTETSTKTDRADPKSESRAIVIL